MGGSIPSLNPYIERIFINLVKRDCKFRFLLLKPGSYGESMRRKTRGSWPLGQPETDIRWLLNIKESLENLSGNFRIGLYSSEPVWAMVIIDNKEAIIGFYSKGVGRDNPGIVVKRIKNKPSFLEAFKIQYEKIWSNSQEIFEVLELDEILLKNRVKENKGFVFAVSGPSGAGKTTICNMLKERKYGLPSVTVTTRKHRSKDEINSGQYEYVSIKKFKRLSKKGEFLCETYFCGNFYGIRPNMVFNVINNNNILILDTIIPPNVLRKVLGDRVVNLCLTPNSIDTLKERISKRKKSIKDNNLRLQEAKKQLLNIKNYDYLILADEKSNEVIKKVVLILENIKESYIQYGSIFPKKLSCFRSENVILEKGLNFDE